MTVLRNIGQLATCPADSVQQDAGLLTDAALVFDENGIKWVGSESLLPETFSDRESIDCGQKLVIPGLIDCHTHLCFGGRMPVDSIPILAFEELDNMIEIGYRTGLKTLTPAAELAGVLPR